MSTRTLYWPTYTEKPPPERPTLPVSEESRAKARPVRSPWNQWLLPPPMMTAAGRSAAKERARRTMVSAGTPVTSEAFSGVQASSSFRTRAKPGVTRTREPSASFSVYSPSSARSAPSGTPRRSVPMTTAPPRAASQAT